jgi:HSP20 family protein
MDLTKFAPWNWFKDEDENKSKVVPVKRDILGTSDFDTILEKQKDFEDLFDLFRKNIENTFAPLRTSDVFKSSWFKPSLDISSGDNDYTIKIELPGVDLKDIEIEVHNHTMTIKGEKKQEHEERDKDFYRIERSYGSFQRVLNLPEDSDTNNILSEHKDGILTVKISKKELPQSDVKKIEIKSS